MAPYKCTKAEIVDIVYEKSGINRSDIKSILDISLDAIKEALRGNRTVELRGFGTFEVRFRKGRAKARNPRTGEFVPPCPHGIVAFRPGKEIKRDVWTNGRPPDTEPSQDTNGV
jgi:integration host factor subunit beta